MTQQLSTATGPLDDDQDAERQHDVEVTPEYELRHPDGDRERFDDIGDAVDFQTRLHPDSTLYRRTVTTVVVYGEWAEVTE
jgi:hypothetical protein